MHNATPLIAMIVAGLVTAFAFSMIAVRLKVSPLIGYVLAGVVVGPFTPGYVADQELANELAELGVILLMFGVGLHFSVRDLMLPLIATVLIVILGKSVAAYGIVRAFGRPPATAFTIAASLAQIGEFSFILAALGTSLGLLPPEGRDLILAGAIISILLNPLFFTLIGRVARRVDGGPEPATGTGAPSPTGHVVLVGYGRVGSRVGRELAETGQRMILMEIERDIPGIPDVDNVTLLTGNAASPHLLRRADLENARLLFVAIPQTFEAGQIVEQARAISPKLRIVARAHSEQEVSYLKAKGADATIMGEEEIARRMIDQALAGV
jgi:CPA2 family monovalent cation:H+ antiporter-2